MCREVGNFGKKMFQIACETVGKGTEILVEFRPDVGRPLGQQWSQYDGPAKC